MPYINGPYKFQIKPTLYIIYSKQEKTCPINVTTKLCQHLVCQLQVKASGYHSVHCIVIEIG